jgi:hypothetical protein
MVMVLLSNDQAELDGVLAPSAHLAYWVAIRIDREHPPVAVVADMVALQAALVVGEVASLDIQFHWATVARCLGR